MRGPTIALIGGASGHRGLVSALARMGPRSVALRALPEAEVPASLAVVVLDGEAERLGGYASLSALRALPGGADLPVVMAYPGAPPSDTTRPPDRAVFYLPGDASEAEARALIERLMPGSGPSPLEALVDQAPLGMAALDADGRVRVVNARFIELAGGDEARVRAAPFGGLRIRDHDGADSGLDDTPPGRWEGAVSVEWMEEEHDLFATLDAAPGGGHRLLWVTEATPARQLERTLSEAARMEAVERLAGGVAHDFNNILSVITTLSDLLIRLRPDDDPDLEDLEEIFRSAQRGSDITRQLSAFSRSAPGEPEVVNLDERLRTNEKMIRRFLSEDISLDWALDAEAPAIRVDPSQLDQMILNLALNARDAMPDGGTLTIGTTTRQVAERTEMAGLPLEPGAYAVLTVVDTGEGMDEATRERLFEPFFTTRSWGCQSGLGLSVVHGTLRAMGGAIRVESEPSRGTRFEIWIPAWAAAEPEPADEPMPTGTETVLLVEDHTELRRSMRRALAGLGYRVMDAADGAEALALVADGGLRPHLVVTDVVMPKLSGPELGARIRDLGLSVPTLFLSGYIDHPAVERLRRSGVRVLSKPLEPMELARAVRTALEHSAPDPSDGTEDPGNRYD